MADNLKNSLFALSFITVFSVSGAFADPATISPAVECVRDNCVQYKMTSRDGFTIFLREWLKPNDNTPAASRMHAPNTQSLLMMPGFPHSSMIVWERQVNDSFLSFNYRMVTMEIRGFGDSNMEIRDPEDSRKPVTSADFAPERWADDIRDAINLLNLHRPVLMSHSFSGTVLTQYLQQPEGDSNLGGIVLTSSFTKNDLSNPAFGGETFDPKFVPVGPGLLGLTNDLGDFYRAGIAFGDLSFFKIDAAYKNRVGLTDMMVPPATRQAMFLPPIFVDNSVLATVHVPAMVVHAKDNCSSRRHEDGHDDSHEDRRENEHAKNKCKKSRDNLIQLTHAINNFNLLKTSSSNASLKIMNKVGHFPQAEQPLIYNSILVNFLQSL